MERAENPQSEFAKFLQMRFSELPVIDQKYFQYGSVLVGLSASTSGLLSSRIFRQTMKVRRGFIISSFIVTSLPLFQTTLLYHVAIPNAIMSGKMNCSLCNTIRGTCIGTIAGGLGSASLAALVTTAYFLKYDKRPLPNDLFRFCINLYKPALMKLKYFFLLQSLFCMAVSARYYAVYEKMLMIPPQPEEAQKK
ncbi:transmembrane protein 126A isoform 1-T2 [Anomaloglossus baeobatrachus]|uniref:transmembrane protein 126A n=1 Tax=Anomaloglossus baeobatrachus TaxID=238106 RepID=UPI003F503E1F